jgi:hypothetical protein
MIKTNYGVYDGDSWEDWCQVLLKTKFDSEGYQEMPAHTRGDLGIEGFTRTGKVFQCYCPDEEYDTLKLYEAQRDKVTKDLNKLSRNKEKLQEFLKDIKIEKWFFLTPIITNKDIVKHCHTKAVELRGNDKLTDLISPEFDVLIHDEEFYSKEILITKAVLGDKIRINIEEPKSEEIINWKQCETEGIRNISRKVNYVFDDPLKADRYIDMQVKNYIRGQKIINHLENNFTHLYEKKTRIKNTIAIHLEEDVLMSDKVAKEIVKETVDKYKKALVQANFEHMLEFGVTDNLTKEAIADWLISCQLDFGG